MFKKTQYYDKRKITQILNWTNNYLLILDNKLKFKCSFNLLIYIGVLYLTVTRCLQKYQDIDKQRKLSKFRKHITNMLQRDRRGRDRMLVGFTITYAISTYHH